jgi:hypothetical protein
VPSFPPSASSCGLDDVENTDILARVSTASPRTTGVPRVLVVLATALALLVGHVVATAPGVAADPVDGRYPAVDTSAGPAWLLTKNALASGPERTALIDLLVRQIERQRRTDTIRLTTWSFHSERVADALVEARRRGVTVRVVLDQKNTRTAAVRSLRRALGTSASRESYVVAPYPQSTHAKVATFSRDGTVLISSANVSDPRQWNHSLVLQNPDLYVQTSEWVDLLASGEGMRYTRISVPGIVLHFYPGTADPVLRALRRADGRPVTIQMSIWKGDRGNQIAQALIDAHRQGSVVAVTTGEPWSDAVRAVAAAGIDVFDSLRATGGQAKAHDKLLIVGDDVYTGSTNWGAFPRRFSELVAHITSRQLADQLRDYVSRTRVQAGGAPIASVARPQPFAVDPIPGGLEASWSAGSVGDLSDLTSFDVTVTGAGVDDATVLTRRTVTATTLPSGVVDPVAVHRARFTKLDGGVRVTVTLSPMGHDGPIGPAVRKRVTPYLRSPAVPIALSAVPSGPRRADVAFSPVDLPHAPPRKGFDVAWSSDRGQTWTSRLVTGTRLTLRSLPPDVRTEVKVREVPVVGSPSPFTAPARVRPSKRPSRPQAVTVHVRRPGVAAVRWQDPAYSGTAPVDEWVARFAVDRSADRTRGGSGRMRVADRDTNLLVLRDLPARGLLQVRLAAVNEHGRSAFSRATPVQLAD